MRRYERVVGGQGRVVVSSDSRLNYDCKEPFAREQVIVDELSLLCNELITDLTKIEPGLKDAIDRFTKMMKITNETYSSNEMVGGYIKYVLREGTLFEKTRLIRNLDVRLALRNRKLVRL